MTTTMLTTESLEEISGHYEQIKRLIISHERARTDSQRDAAIIAIHETPLCVEVRSGWYPPTYDMAQAGTPEEYCILLGYGGPSVRLTGSLLDGEPVTATLEHQDWGTPWTPYRATPKEQAFLLAFARFFDYGA